MTECILFLFLFLSLSLTLSFLFSIPFFSLSLFICSFASDRYLQIHLWVSHSITQDTPALLDEVIGKTCHGIASLSKRKLWRKNGGGESISKSVEESI